MIFPRFSVIGFGVMLFILSSMSLLAHPGHYHPEEEVDEFADESFLVGAVHPFTGLDHLVAALAVGGLAYSLGRRGGSAVAVSFLGAVALGYAAGYGGVGVPMLEPGLALAVAVAGLLLIMQQRFSPVIRLIGLALIGCWNGNAHGMEAANFAYGLGLLAGTAVITLMGAGLVAAVCQWSPQAPRWAGAAALVTGLVLIAGRLA